METKKTPIPGNLGDRQKWGLECLFGNRYNGFKRVEWYSSTGGMCYTTPQATARIFETLAKRGYVQKLDIDRGRWASRDSYRLTPAGAAIALALLSPGCREIYDRLEASGELAVD